MPTINPVTLRALLVFDALTCLLMGTGLLVASGLIEAWLGIPAAVSVGAGGVLLAFGAGVGWAASRPTISPLAVSVIVAANTLWAAESLLALAFGWLTPNVWGQGFVVVQAVAVALIAQLQFLGVRTLRRAAA